MHERLRAQSFFSDAASRKVLTSKGCSVRPAGEISQALINAARELCLAGRGATLQEMADLACVGRQAARDLVPKLKSRGHLAIVGERSVEYRNRPVKEYAPASTLAGADVYHGHLELVACMSRWGG